MESRPRSGKYRIVAELGHGGMADVYLAVLHRPMGFSKLQVLKLLRADLAEQADFRTMFLEEARLAARLSHPNIVQTVDVGEDAGRYYMAMEYLEGQTLDRIQRRAAKSGGVPQALLLTVLCEILRGLQYAHEVADETGMPLQIVHRDVSPHNVLVTYDGEVKLVDFGIAKAADSALQTRTGVLKGKLTYMSPEQARSEPVDRRADVFSVGVMLWEAATRARMWEGLSEVQVLHRLATGEFRERLVAGKDLDPKLRAITERALAPRDARYPTAAAMEAELAAYLGGEMPSRERAPYVAGLFEKERSTVRARVDLQLRAMKAADSESSVPALLLTTPLTSSTPAGAFADDEDAPPPEADEEEPPSTRAPLDAATSVTVAGRPTSTELTTPRGFRVPALVAANIVLAIAVGWVLTREPHASTKGVAATAASAPSASASVSVRVRIDPPETRVMIDDAPVENPFVAEMAADRSVHRVRAEAHGYAPIADAFVLDGRPIAIERTLERLHAEPPAKTAKTGTAPPTPSASPPASGKPPKGGLPLDKDDPWSK